MHPTRLVAVFSSLEDPRVERTRRHALVDVIVIAILATIADCDGWDEVEAFAEFRLAWLRTFLDLRRGSPSADTFRRVFEAIDPKAFAVCFATLVADLAGRTDGAVIPIDGKTMRRTFSRSKGQGPLHMVSAWVADKGITLGQVATEEKSNEITAIPELLTMIDVRGSTVTIDAMGCQKAIAVAIVDKKADYILALKDNQPTLHTEVQAHFADATADGFAPVVCDEHVTENKGHGRIERRRVRVSNNVDWIADVGAWRGLRSIAEVERTRTSDGKTSTERAYFISSLDVDAKTFGERVRAHWSIENKLHWVLDVVFHEDSSRIRDRNSATNLALLRKLALALVAKETSNPKRSRRQKRKMASWEPNYLFTVLEAAHAP